MKRFAYLIFCLFLCLGTFSQELKVKSFTLDNDLEARTNPILDKDGNPCALVKIPMGDEIANVDGNVISIKDHYGEKWVYLTDGTKDIKIFHKRGISLRVYFPDYGINGVMGKCTYVLDWVKTVSEAVSVIQQSQSIIIKYTPSTATVLVDNKMVRGSNGVAKTTLPVGQHSYIVACDGYESEEGMVKLKPSAPSNLQITLTKEKVSVGSVDERSVRQTIGKQQSITNQTNSSVASGSYVISIPVKRDIKIEMVKVEAGTFMMGATSEMENMTGQYEDLYEGMIRDEKPIHQVSITNDYYMGKYEVTQALWETIMGYNPSTFKGGNLPVEGVSWNDCLDFIYRLNRKTGRKFRLPTEAEWEYAARGGKKGCNHRYSGSSNISDVAWYSDEKTYAVGTKLSNELGLYDMSGNVSEWCQDWYGSYSDSCQINPTGVTSGTERVCRGGNWRCLSEWACRLSDRNHDQPYRRYNGYGLRLVLSE